MMEFIKKIRSPIRTGRQLALLFFIVTFFLLYQQTLIGFNSYFIVYILLFLAFAGGALYQVRQMEYFGGFFIVIYAFYLLIIAL